MEQIFQSLLSHRKDPRPEIEPRRKALVDWALSHQVYDETSYSRNVICSNLQGDEVVLACWKNGHKTPFHNHSGQNCWMTVIQGELKEIRIRPSFKIQPDLMGWEDFQKVYQSHNQWSSIESSKVVKIVSPSEWNYIDDSQGIHCVESLNDQTISFHVYRNL